MAEAVKIWKEISRSYRAYLRLEKHLAANTIESYMRDLEQFGHFVLLFHDVPPREVTRQMVEHYMSWLYEHGREKSSQARSLSGIKSFFNFMLLNEMIETSPAEMVEAPKAGRPLPDTLTVEEIDRLIGSIDPATKKGLRDRAILELLYSCGLRVTELCDLKIGDLFFGEGYIRVTGKGDKQRLGPQRRRHALSEQPRHTPHARHDLHHHTPSGQACRHRQTHQPPHLPPLLRHTPARRRRQHTSGAGAVGA